MRNEVSGGCEERAMRRLWLLLALAVLLLAACGGDGKDPALIHI